MAYPSVTQKIGATISDHRYDLERVASLHCNGNHALFDAWSGGSLRCFIWHYPRRTKFFMGECRHSFWKCDVLSAIGFRARRCSSRIVRSVHRNQVRWRGLPFISRYSDFSRSGSRLGGDGQRATNGAGLASAATGLLAASREPKALIFFAALLPQFISPKIAVAPQVAILGMTSVTIEFLVLAGYGYLAGRAALLARTPRFAAATNRASGVMLIAAGTGLALANDK